MKAISTIMGTRKWIVSKDFDEMMAAKKGDVMGFTPIQAQVSSRMQSKPPS